MKTIILAGGFGTRLSEYTDVIPKPMVMINQKPILLRIINIFTYYGYKDYYLALGYKAELISSFFDTKINEKTNYIIQNKKININLIDTGLETMTGGRIKRLREYIGNETFLLTYGDGVGDIDISKLVEFHKSQKKMVTVTAVRPPARFGALTIEGNLVTNFEEKNPLSEGWINGGFFVIEPEFFEFLKDDQTILERNPLENVAKKGQLCAYKHEGFWQCMDTKRDKDFLEESSLIGNEPWKT
tara:strand:+ start:3229 stop:3957 length:729 start_codon:yes stop_codon:yes gene_type:complete